MMLYILATILIGFCVLVVFFMAYLHHIHKINDHLPGPPRSSFILGHLQDIWEYQASTGKTRLEYLVEKRFEYGPIFVIFFMHKAVVFLADSSYLRHVFINNHQSANKNSHFYRKFSFVFGERGSGFGLVTNTDEVSWRKKRHLMNPAFRRKCLREFQTNFNDVCDRFLLRMDTIAHSGRPTSMVEEFAKVTLEAISQVSFNFNTQAIEDLNSPFPTAIRHYLQGVQTSIEVPLSATVLAIFQFKLFQNDTKREQINGARFLRKFASDCVKTRMQEIADGTNNVPDDLLSLLIKDGTLSMDEIVDEFLTIFVAGQETTANSLSFTLYELIRNPHVEAKALNELNEVLGDRDYVEFDDLAKLKYLGQVLEESLRKHPVALAPLRILSKDIKIGGYRVRKGTGVCSLQPFFGMNPEIWKDPEVFDPERFSNAENMPNLSMIHFPFSIGPRNCIGQSFARFESKVILAKLLRKFRFDLLPGQTDRILERFTLSPRDGVMCMVSRHE